MVIPVLLKKKPPVSTGFPHTPEQDAQLQAETINNKPFIHIPVKIRRLFHENEATDYMQKTAAFLTRAVSTREKALHLHDITRRSLSSNIDNNMNLSVASQEFSHAP